MSTNTLTVSAGGPRSATLARAIITTKIKLQKCKNKKKTRAVVWTVPGTRGRLRVDACRRVGGWVGGEASPFVNASVTPLAQNGFIFLRTIVNAFFFFLFVFIFFIQKYIILDCHIYFFGWYHARIILLLRTVTITPTPGAPSPRCFSFESIGKK